MAKAAKYANTSTETSDRRAYWSTQIEQGKKRYRNFHDAGENVVDEYRQQKSDGNAKASKDKYNILYSSTETIRPNLYAKLPVVRVALRNKDTATQAQRDGVELLRSNLQYVIEEEDFDDLMAGVVEDTLLPGIGQGWVRYQPTFEKINGEDGKPVLDENGKETEKLVDEQVILEYVFWRDFLTGVGRTWKTIPWVAKRCWMTKEAAMERFGAAKANQLTYASRDRNQRDADCSEDTAEVWEIWDKRSRNAYWYSDSYAGDLLDTQKDPLKLKGFFPCPRPVRAVSNTREYVPCSLYSQYKTQAEQINNLTRRIRLLTDALKVVGVFDASNEKLSDMLNPISGNKMIPIEGWVAFSEAGGIKGSIQWLPLADVVAALTQLIAAREVCKAEIYEITGFSDILRGVSKASETLGAQNIKANWGGARLKNMQKEIQRFARDMIALAGEVIAEHCEPATIALFGGVQLPSPEEATSPEGQAILKRFQDAVGLLKNENRRVAAIDIETDSTILANEEAERADRTAFLAAAGAFLQQAVPAMEATPELGPLLGAMLMFTVRTFPSSQPIEEAFEAVMKAMQNRPPKQQDNGEAMKAQAAAQAAQIQQQTEQARIQAETGIAQAELTAKQQAGAATAQQAVTAEENRHAERMAELSLKQREIDIRERELNIKEAELNIKQQAQALDEQVAAEDASATQQELDLEGQRIANEDARAQEEASRAEQEALTPEGEAD